VVDWISVPLGVATLRDQFRDVEDDGARFALMSWFFEENLAEFAPYKDEPSREGFQIVGTSGTVTTVAASHLGLKRYDRNKVDGLRMTSDEIDKVIRSICRLARLGAGDPRIGADRQALIMSGAAILAGALAVLAHRPAFGGGSGPARGHPLFADVGRRGAGQPVKRCVLLGCGFEPCGCGGVGWALSVGRHKGAWWPNLRNPHRPRAARTLRARAARPEGEGEDRAGAQELLHALACSGSSTTLT
jgi:hypothetical protein